MEVLLLQDVAGVGKKNDVLVVGDGFALNYLLPQRKALVATPTVRKRYADQIKRRAEEKESEKNVQQAAASAISGKTVQFQKKASKNGKLYAAITTEEIAAGIKSQLDMDVKADALIIAEPIKSVGTAQVQVVIANAQFPLNIVIAAEKEKAVKKAE